MFLILHIFMIIIGKWHGIAVSLLGCGSEDKDLNLYLTKVCVK